MSVEDTASSQSFIRTRLTWQAYLTISYYSYLLNSLGPLTPFLRDELNLSYTLTSFHFSAYALGVIVTGLLLHRVVSRFGGRMMVWTGVAGMAAGALLLVVGRTPLITIFGAFLMGLLGVMISALFSTALAQQYGENRAIALTESTMIASLFSTLAPMAVGFFGGTLFTWRGALVVMMCAGPVLWLVFRNERLENPAPAESGPDAPPARPTGVLPRRYWLFWGLAFLVEAVEFCVIFWAADFLGKVTGMDKGGAALGTSAFLGAMLVGRWWVSRLLRRSQERRLLMVSLLIALTGFLLFWLVPAPAAAVIGLVITGLGVAGLFPIVNSLALASAPDQMMKASARITLAVGLSILLLPLVLGRLADGFGIRPAYGIEVVLLLLSLALVAWTGRGRAS